MMNKPEILQWISTLADDSFFAINGDETVISTLADDSFIAIDDEGLNLVEIDSDGNQTDAYLEIGGVDDEEN